VWIDPTPAEDATILTYMGCPLTITLITEDLNNYFDLQIVPDTVSCISLSPSLPLSLAPSLPRSLAASLPLLPLLPLSLSPSLPLSLSRSLPLSLFLNS
jgi:hypothetical protein